MKINFKKIMILVMGILFLLIYKFLNEHFGIAIYCPFYILTGFYCPGCGITRMFLSILQLDFYQAFRYNPLVFILFVGVILLKILRFNFSKKSKKYVSYFLLVIVIFYGVFRNIELFSYLQPTIIH